MNRFQNDFLIRYRKCNVSLCRCQTLASKSPKRANKLGCIREKFGKWPPRSIKFYQELFPESIKKRTLHENLYLFWIHYRNPYANRLEQLYLKSIRNRVLVIKWRTPCIINIFINVQERNLIVKLTISICIIEVKCTNFCVCIFYAEPAG